jgi:hypothetical protein
MRALSLAILLIVSLILAGYREAGAVDYRLFAENDEGLFYYDIETITRSSKDTVQVWVREVFSGQGKRVMSRILGEGHADLDHSILQEELNCRDKTFRYLSRAIYTKHGAMLSSSKSQIGKFEAIQPNSVDEVLYNTVCGQERK